MTLQFRDMLINIEKLMQKDFISLTTNFEVSITNNELLSIKPSSSLIPILYGLLKLNKLSQALNQYKEKIMEDIEENFNNVIFCKTLFFKR